VTALDEIADLQIASSARSPESIPVVRMLPNATSFEELIYLVEMKSLIKGISASMTVSSETIRLAAATDINIAFYMIKIG